MSRAKLEQAVTNRTSPASPFSWRRDGEVDRLAPFERHVHWLLLDELAPRAWSRVLVLQCGDGWAAEEIRRRLGRGSVCGLDLSAKKVRQAQRLRAVPDQLEFGVWDGRTLAFPNQSFDCALLSFALNLHDHPVDLLKQVNGILRPGGRLLVLEVDRRAFHGLYTLWDHVFRLTNTRHVRYYETREVLAFLKAAGFANAAVRGRYERLWSGGKLLAGATILSAERGMRDQGPKDGPRGR